MRRFLVRRFFLALLTLLAATAIVFSLSRAAGDPLLLYAKPGGYGVSPQQIEALKKKLGLDKPLVVQYFLWLGNTLKGDLGRTLLDEKKVSKVMSEKIGATLQLALGAWLFATLVGVPLGVLSAVKRSTVWDYLGRSFALMGQALPPFWIGIVAVLIFAVELQWLPSGTRPRGVSFWELVKHFIMPAITLGWFPAAGYMRLTRSAMLDVLDSEFIKLARAKGVKGTSVVWRHAFRNALIPPLTLSGLILAGFLTGAVIVETVFAWPGIGNMAVQAVWNNDFPLLTGSVLMFAVIFVTMNFLTDVAYAYIDPRIRYT
jgi:peptide/nickel transport system permease protein